MMMHCIPMSGLIENPKLYSTIRVSLMEKEGGEVAEALYDHAACYEQDIAQAMKDFPKAGENCSVPLPTSNTAETPAHTKSR